MARFMLDWTPTVHGAMLICGSGTWLTVAGVTYTYIEYSLYVPLLFLWEGGSQRDGPFQCHFQWQSTNAGPFAEQEAVKHLELLARSSKHPPFGLGPSKGQYTVTSQKLDSWLVAPRSRGGEEGHSAASHVLFVTFIWLSYVAISSRIVILAPLISHSLPF